ncbi:glycosyltransferase [Thalassotalea piscium]
MPMSISGTMAAQLPVIATNVGGIPQVVKNNETGILVEDKDKKGLITAIEWMMDNPIQSQKLGKAGRLILEKNYSIKQAIEQYEHLYIA